MSIKCDSSDPGLVSSLSGVMNDLFKNLTDSPINLGAVILSLGSLGYVLMQGLKKLTTGAADARPPPGPPRAFLLGNLRQFPRNHFLTSFVNGSVFTVGAFVWSWISCYQ